MPTFSVTGKAMRTVREIVEFEVEVNTWGLGGVESAVREAVARGDYEELDSYEDESVASSPLTITELGEVRREETPVYTQTAPTPAQPYRAASGGQGYQPTQAGSGASGMAVARVETRPNGYSPARVRHVPGR